MYASSSNSTVFWKASKASSADGPYNCLSTSLQTVPWSGVVWCCVGNDQCLMTRNRYAVFHLCIGVCPPEIKNKNVIRLFENMTESGCLGMTVTIKFCFREEINTLNSGN
jgi:hypothetical protein